MDCLKCNCGCDNLNKEELKALMKVCEKVRDFVNSPTARAMFRRMFYPDEPDSYEPQPSGSRNHPVGKRPKPKAIKYLDCIEEAQMLLQAHDLGEEVVQEFAERIPDEELGNRLYDSTESNRNQVLQAIITEYGNLLFLNELYKRFELNLSKAYEGKVKIEKR
uniref:RGS domain-containing protein n=1 Tax=Anopheles funestus TaxID=62324 RepID=A0A182R664_ANOFN